MALVPRRAWSELDRFFDDDNWFLPVVPRTKILEPAIDFYEEGSNLIAEISLPGIDPAKINISVKDDVLRVSGNYEEKKEEKGRGYLRKEMRSGSFERTLQLPEKIQSEKIEAVYEKGILKVVLPKIEKEPEKKIEIKVKEK